jgi:hypothetical protein
VYIEGVVLPLQAPPSFDLRLCLNTISKLMKLKASKLYFSHFGASDRVQENLQISMDKLQIWGDMVAEAMKANAIDAVTERIKARLCAELEPARNMKALYEYLTNTWGASSVAAHVQYHQENLS